ncbi:MAG: ATP-binding cassette domain-containing protein [Paracoccaceae bacterium]
MEKAQTSISINSLSCAVDGKVILDNITFDLTSGQSISVTGPNGVGKTLFLHTILGF